MGRVEFGSVADFLEALARDIRSGAVEVRGGSVEEYNAYVIKDTPGFERDGRSGQMTVHWFRALAQAQAGAGEGQGEGGAH